VSRRVILLVGVLALLATGLVAGISSPVIATPVATDDGTYQLFGRVFPDPHGCVRGQPGTSPWAKGEVCAGQYIQWDEALGGLTFLEARFDRYLDVLNLHELFAEDPQFAGEVFQSAGLPKPDLTRDVRDLYVVKVTDAGSPVAEAGRRHFAYSLSIHGIERAGLEGGIRAIEDLVTWAACEEDPAAAPACTAEGPFPKAILEPSNSGPSAGQVLDNAVIYFVFANPDGWHRGEWSEGGVFFQRYNGNGMDLNRDWPSVGYTEAQYTPWSEPESRGYGAYLKYVAEQTAAGRFAGAIDLHGMLTAPSFSFTLLGAGQRDYRKNAISVETSILTFRDSEERLSWSPLIAPAGDCPQGPQEPVFGGYARMCSDQWGTVWDTINYQVTGSFGDWMDSPIGLDAVGIDNEMALSHITPNNVFDPQISQLHIDGNKGLVYSQIAALLFEDPVQYETPGTIGYVFDPARITNPGGGPPEGDPSELPAQEPIEGIELSGEGFEFEVAGPRDGIFNGGLAVEATCTNAQGIGACTGTGAVSVFMILDYCGAPQHVGDPEGECVEVARYFNQSPIYSQAGARIDLNDPPAGPYRIRPSAARVGPVRYEVTFSEGSSYPVPDQAAYDVSRMDFFSDLNGYATEPLLRVPVTRVLKGARALQAYDTIVVANDFMPGFDPDPSLSMYSRRQFTKYAETLASFAQRGGNLVLTDAALTALPALGTGIAAEQVSGGVFYAGWMDFDDGQGPTYDRHPLAAGVNKEGTAEGQATIAGQRFDNRHQTYEPVPLGYYVGPGGSGNAACTSDRCDSPNWIVDQSAWEAAGGTVAARTLVRATTEPNSPTTTGVSLGELPVGDGVIRIAGSLLPDPTEQNYHPYGLFSYALTYTGYQVFENLANYQR
jgi:hypothetical protein